MLREEILPGGGHLSFVLKRGQILRMTDIEGGANVSLLMLNPHEKSERLNLPDTLKGQHTARLTAGHCFYSDMGRVLAGITADTCGWHDPFGGVLNAAEVTEKYGQDAIRNCATGFTETERTTCWWRWGSGISISNLLMVVNFFSKVTVDDRGQFTFHGGYSQPGSYVELYAPMDTLVVMTALQHPMDPSREYAPRPVALSWRQAEDEEGAVNALLTRPENERAMTNTRLFAL